MECVKGYPRSHSKYTARKYLGIHAYSRIQRPTPVSQVHPGAPILRPCSSLRSHQQGKSRREWHRPRIKHQSHLAPYTTLLTTDFIKIENKVQFTDVIKEGIYSCFSIQLKSRFYRVNIPSTSTNKCIASR